MKSILNKSLARNQNTRVKMTWSISYEVWRWRTNFTISNCL